MTVWEVSTTEKKCVEEQEIWSKGDFFVTVKTGYRSGTWTVTTPTEEPPKFDDDSEFDIYDTEYDVELDSLDDGCWTEFEFSDNMPEEEQNELRELLENEGSSILDEDGWASEGTECWVWCNLDIKRKE